MLCSVQVPMNLLRGSRIFTFEPPPGIKANLMRTFSTVPAARMCKVSVSLAPSLLPLTPFYLSSRSIYLLPYLTPLPLPSISLLFTPLNSSFPPISSILTPSLHLYLIRSLTRGPGSISSWPGSMPSSRSGSGMRHSAGPRNTSLTSLTCEWAVTL